MYIIIAQRKEDYIDNTLGEDRKEAKCSYCDNIIIYGDMVYRQALNEQREKDEKKIKFACVQCYKTFPKFGKHIRPSQEIINKMRQEGVELDEVKIRKMMHDIKNKKMEK